MGPTDSNKTADGPGTANGTSTSFGRAVDNDLNDPILTPSQPNRAKRMVQCGVPSCGKKSEQLTFATSHVLSYFGFKNRLAIVKVCGECVTKADVYQKKCTDAIKMGESLFKLKHEPQSVPEMIDLEDDTAPSSPPQLASSEEIEVDFERDEVDGLVRKLLGKFDIHSLLQKCTTKASEEANQLTTDFRCLDKTIDNVDRLLQDTCKRYNKLVDRRPQPMVIQEVEINANGSVRRRNLAGDKSVFIDNAAIAKLSQRQVEQENSAQEKATMEDAAVAELLAAERKPGPASKTGYFERLNAARSGPFQRKIKVPGQEKKVNLLPTPSVIPRVQPVVGDYVYAMNKSLLNYWLQGEVREHIRNEDTDQTEYIIEYEPTLRGKPTGGVMLEGDGSLRLMRQLTLKQLAFNVPCPFVLPVGTRIIAKFKDELNTEPDSDGHYYAGIIAEPPKPSSKQRYLIFFDDGYAQYVQPDGILLVCQASNDVWTDIHPDSYDFIKDYVIRYPEWPMVRLHEGSLVSTEWNGRWLVARILEIDGSLVKVRFENDGREEWIYRGSPRFRPIYRCLAKEEEKGRQLSCIPRHDASEQAKRNADAPPVEYKYDDVVGTAAATDKRGARKSTGRFQYYDMFGGLNSNHINMMDPDLCIEFQGTITKVKLPDDLPKPKDLVPHSCDSDCVVKYVPSKELKKISPLAIPLHFGWAREVGRAPRRTVLYRTPCGVRVRDFTELKKFLSVTYCNLSIDYFCFDYDVDCLNEFEPARSLTLIKDISYGKEAVPVQCLNAVDYESLPYMEYTAARIPGANVNINSDEGFLTCCDCTDNCEDKSKCACWKLTMEGITFTKLSEGLYPAEGYENRRLKDHIVSGIYECNSGCHCKKETCSNRVVQNGVTWPLQVFKTTKKGWGIRALYDMPEGSFICIYAGQILTDQCANEEGQEFGDEYLAELDYIECCEDVKANYESDVTDIEAEGSDDEDGSTKRKRSRASHEDSEVDEEEAEWSANDGDFVDHEKSSEKSRKMAARRTTGQKKNISVVNNDDDIITARSASHFNPKIQPNRAKKIRSLRELFGANANDEQCYIMDAKSKGNIGRYLNHSCNPNVFVQNVFVDTHDLRFPMVAFFTNKFVQAGSELTWDYHYQIGSVPGKTMYCFCNTPYCRGRLL